MNHHGTDYRTVGGCSFRSTALPACRQNIARLKGLHSIAPHSHGLGSCLLVTCKHTPAVTRLSLPAEVMPCFTTAPLYYDTINLEDMHAGKDALFR